MTLTEKRSSPSHRGKGNKSPKSTKDKPAGAKASTIKGKADGTKVTEVPESTPKDDRKQAPPAPVTEETTKKSPMREQPPPSGKPPKTILKDGTPEQPPMKPEQSSNTDLFDGLSLSHGTAQDSTDKGQTDPDKTEPNITVGDVIGKHDPDPSVDDVNVPKPQDKMTNVAKLLSTGKTITQEEVARAIKMDDDELLRLAIQI